MYNGIFCCIYIFEYLLHGTMTYAFRIQQAASNIYIYLFHESWRDFDYRMRRKENYSDVNETSIRVKQFTSNGSILQFGLTLSAFNGWWRRFRCQMSVWQLPLPTRLLCKLRRLKMIKNCEGSIFFHIFAKWCVFAPQIVFIYFRKWSKSQINSKFSAR